MLKKKLFYLLPVLSAILVVGGSKAQAQVIGRLKAQIPFEFHAGGATLPAGNYTISVLGGIESHLIEIRSADNHSTALVQTMAVDFDSVPKTSELLFNQTGGDYYLAKIFDQDGSSGIEVEEPVYAKKYKASIATADQKQVAVVSNGY